MKAIRPKLKEQRGQTLIWVALALVVLLAAVALAVDIGNAYSHRRQMQNAADAGALAGARERCWGTPANYEAAARNYAITQNGAEAAVVNLTRDGWGVEVTTSFSVPTSIARVIGINAIPVAAAAEAVCGAATTACGLWPVGISTSQWQYLYQHNGCNGDPFYVWSGSNTNDNPDCTIYDCDVDGDGDDDVINMQGRSWMDFSENVVSADPFQDTCAQSGCGTSELSCWIREDSNVRLTLPACIAGDNGVRAAVKDDVIRRIGDRIAVPLFDSTGCGGPVCPGGTSYRVVGLGCIEVTTPGWDQNLELPRKDGANPPWKDKVIIASLRCSGCKTSCGTTNGTPPPEGGVRAVSLIR